MKFLRKSHDMKYDTLFMAYLILELVVIPNPLKREYLL